MKCTQCQREWSGQTLACPVCGYYLGKSVAGGPVDGTAANVPSKGEKRLHFRFKDPSREMVRKAISAGASGRKHPTWDELAALSEAYEHGLVPGGVPEAVPVTGDSAVGLTGGAKESANGRRRGQVQTGKRRMELFILLALLVETCMVTADYYSPVLPIPQVKTAARTVASQTAPEIVLLKIKNHTGVPVFVRIGNRLIATSNGERMAKQVTRGEYEIAWWFDTGDGPSAKTTCRESLTQDAAWNFELVYKDGTPILLRTLTVAQKDEKIASATGFEAVP